MTVLSKTQFISKTEIIPSHARRSSNSAKLITSEAFHVFNRKNSFLANSSDSGNEDQKTRLASNQTFTHSITFPKEKTWLDTAKEAWMSLPGKLNIIREIEAPDGSKFAAPSKDTLFYLAKFIETDILSDYGLLKDKYLFEQIVEKKQGWIRIRFISSLRRVKQKAKDWRIVSLALALFGAKNKFEISECGQKVRRLAPIGEEVYQKHAASTKEKTKIIVIKIPQQGVINQDFIKHLVSCPENNVTPQSIEVLVPGEPMSKYLNSYAVHIPDIGRTLCAAVEYDCENSARKAVKHINGRYATIRSAVLGNKVKRILYNAKTIADDNRVFLGEKLGFTICCKELLFGDVSEPVKNDDSKSVKSEDDASSGCGSSVLTSRLQSNDSTFFKYEKHLMKKRTSTLSGYEKIQVGDRVQQKCAIQLIN